MKVTVIKTTNAKCSKFVEEKIPFKANNIFAEKTSEGNYIVYSYGYHFPIYAFVDGVWYENSDKYSVSTSKQQTQARPSVEVLNKVNTNTLKALIDGQFKKNLQKFNLELEEFVTDLNDGVADGLELDSETNYLNNK